MECKLTSQKQWLTRDIYIYIYDNLLSTIVIYDIAGIEVQQEQGSDIGDNLYPRYVSFFVQFKFQDPHKCFSLNKTMYTIDPGIYFLIKNDK